MTNDQTRKRRVLVVEDDKGMNQALQRKLQNFGCGDGGLL
jgi:ActR/RegA family two-component response regulator